jgi:hypothetical protein
MMIRKESEMMTPDLSTAAWRTSSHSGANGDCVEVASNLAGAVAVRDSKDRSGPVLVFAPAEWDAFVAGMKNGESGLR